MPDKIEIVTDPDAILYISSDLKNEETIEVLENAIRRLQMTVKADELEPCPFCGGKVSVDDIHIVDVSSSTLLTGGLKDFEIYNMLYQVVCRCCSASGATQSSKAQAAESWNMRRGSANED